MLMVRTDAKNVSSSSVRRRMGTRGMKQVGGEDSTLFSLSAAERRYLQQALALGLIKQPAGTREDGAGGLLVRFRSLEDAKHVQGSIA